MNLQDAKSIGILYMATEERNYQTILNFVKELNDNKKTVKTLGFVESKKMPSYCYPQLNFEFTNYSDLNFYKKPKSTFIDVFTETDFDILIDLTMTSYYPAEYIAFLSHAKFKVGRYSDKNTAHFDLMIHANNSITLSEYIKHVIKYLTIINKKNETN